MCGIAGMYAGRVDVPLDPEIGVAMRTALRHRGPDGVGLWTGRHALLAFTRLSIIDLSEGGDQPMVSEDGDVVSVFNGEIYNFRELRQRLLAAGHRFRGASDGEVLPHLYEEEGEACFERLRGMFAAAVYDRRRHQLILARDRFGIKPLYYAAVGDVWLFASEIKALLAHPGLPRRVDPQAIHDYLSLSYVPEPATGFADIMAVVPGSTLVFEGAKLRQTSSWRTAPAPSVQMDVTGATQRVGDLVDEAVNRQLVADVPLGAFLSGGIDSSTVVESASRLQPGRLPTFTVSFPDAGFDESPYARLVAEACRTAHHELAVAAGTADPALVTKVLTHFDQPFGDSSALPTYLICREMRKHVKVALSGDGGDEMFCGYPVFHYVPRILRLGRVPPSLRRAAQTLFGRAPGLSPDVRRQAAKLLRLAGLSMPQLLGALMSYLDEEDKRGLYADVASWARDVVPTSRLFGGSAWAGSDDPQALADSITASLVAVSLAGDMLKKVDMMSMLAGLEVRVPLLDEDLADFAMRLPVRYKTDGGQGKRILRRLAASRLPRGVASKPKWGFGIPLDTWASPAFMSFIEETLLSPDARLREFMRMDEVRRWVNAFGGGPDLRRSISRIGVYQRIYMLLSLELWLRHHRLSWIA